MQQTLAITGLSSESESRLSRSEPDNGDYVRNSVNFRAR